MKKISRRSFLKGTGLLAATSATSALFTACASDSSVSSSVASSSSSSAATANVVNIGSTATLGSTNPLLIDATWINMYAMTLMFNPLVALNEHAEFENMLVDSIESEDNLVYTLHINDAATWSDGTPVTAADIQYTMNMLTSGVIANTTMMMYSLVGTDDATGYRPEGVENVEGVAVVDEKTVTFTFKSPINKTSFMTSYAMYIFPIPAHILKDVAEADLAAYDWFKKPTVVSGPYFCSEQDPSNYVSYTANKDYWKGAPAIENVNIKIVAGAQLLSGLQSGEIDVVPPLLGTINLSDYETVLALENVDAAYGDAYAVENIFFNCNAVPEKEIRQAMLCALDRQMIVDGLFGGAADICDGFAVPAGPYNKDLPVTACDVERAKALVATATENGWDASKTYELYLNNGEETLINAASIAQAAWAAVGINVNLNPIDLDTLMTKCVEGTGDMYGVQYTYPPMDPAQVDISWVLDYWCFYQSDIVSEALQNIWASNDPETYANELYKIDQDVQENVPLLVLYVNGPLGAVAKRISGATANMYGCLNNVHEWTINA